LCKKWDPDLYRKPVAAKINLRTVIEAIERDKQLHGDWILARERERHGRTILADRRYV